ncbi:hypothetical protein ACIBSW_40465 [Actinoplanes sp. NPDC049668]|uniref:hypothetical protein n=1 Tax=unclassified Actinoplanes TaxID=2626549 RepID=UPI0033AB64B6
MSFMVEAANISTAWLKAARKLDAPPKRKAIHSVVRIADPVSEDPAVRAAMDQVLAEQNLQSVDTVANTIFPAAFARSSRDHAELVERYMKIYPLLTTRYSKNNKGTYFARMISYPSAPNPRKRGSGGPWDQISEVIRTIKVELNGGIPKGARYEIGLGLPDDARNVQVFVPGTDTSAMAFPCLSHCSFQQEGEEYVHLLAHYRYQYLVERGYGNFLGLGGLLAYVAGKTGLKVGQLTVVAGMAQLEPPVLPVTKMLDDFADLAAA